MVQINIQDLPIEPADSQSPIPLYYQISLDLHQMIRDQTIPPGATLPPEIEISQAYGVGRQTIRKAIARLVDNNLVERFAGRGTFVRDQTKRSSFHLDRSFSQLMREMGLEARSKVICQETNVIDENTHPVLQPWLDTPCLNLERVRFGDQVPICYQSTIVLTERCSKLGGYDFGSESLYEVLAKDFNLIINRIDHLIRAVAADEYRAELLEISPGSPLLNVVTIAYLEDGDIIEITYSYYRADRYEYKTSEERG